MPKVIMIEEILMGILHHSMIVSYLGAIIGGEDFLLFLAILSGRGVFPLLDLIVFGFLGAMTMDAALYFIGRLERVRHWHGRFTRTKLYKKLSRISTTIHGEREFLPFFFSKFVYGVRWFTIVSMGKRKVPFKKFLAFNGGAVLLWMCIMIPLGWLAGRGFGLLLDLVKGAEKLAVLVLLAIIGFYIIESVMRKIFKKISS